MTRLLVGDIGGTHARFALAEQADDGIRLVSVRTIPVSANDGLLGALDAYLADEGVSCPRQACLAVAGPVQPGRFTLTNSGWAIDHGELAARYDFEDIHIINDFEAVAYTVSDRNASQFAHLAGPSGPLPPTPVTVLGPGTGLGVAIVLPDGRVIPTEGGHIGFAPADTADMQLLCQLAHRYGRVSAERLASGPGLGVIAASRGLGQGMSDPDIWAAALGGEPWLAAVLGQWLSIFGRVAGDLVLAHGAGALVLAGSLVDRLGARLSADPFLAALRDKGRFAAHMAALPVLRLVHAEPGLMGAALAWFRRASKGG